MDNAFTPDVIREAVGPEAEGWTDDQLKAALRDALASLGLIAKEG